MSVEQLLMLPGVGPATARSLMDAGFTDPGSISSASVADLIAIPGFAEARARALLEAASAYRDELEFDARSVEAESDDAVATPAAEPGIEAPGPPAKKRKEESPGGRKQLDRQIETLRDRRAKVKAEIKEARHRLKKASSKKKRSKRSDQLDRLRRKSKKLARRIEKLRSERSDLG